VISDRYRCVFVHIPKAAGQSIEQVFLNLHGLDWQSRSALLLRANSDPELGPPRLAHLHAADYVRCGYLSQEQFSDYFSFTVVRNPWDRMVSLYHYLGFHRRCSFSFFVQALFHQYLAGPLRWFVGPQFEFVCDEQKRLLVKRVLKFEQLEQEFSQVCGTLDIGPLALPHLNSRASARGRSMAPELADYVSRIPVSEADSSQEVFTHYQDYYDPDSRAIVGNYYEADAALFDYQFEPGA
jgi:hypothetical protein